VLRAVLPAARHHRALTVMPSQYGRPGRPRRRNFPLAGPAGSVTGP
jgi:hypothetical protein